jgi:hypothetical protein
VAFAGRKERNFCLKIFLVRIFSACVVATLLSLNCLSQQPNTPTSAPASSSQTEPKKSDTPPANDTNSATQGKSKLEKETGTVNDRILDVMPNYTAQVFDYFAFPFNGALAAIDQANNSPKSWGQGWGAYGKRYGASFADNSIGTFMTTDIFPSMLHEDPRYYQSGQVLLVTGRITQ